MEKHVVASEPILSEECGSEIQSNKAMSVLRDSNNKKEVKVTEVKQGAIVDDGKDISPKHSSGESTRVDTQTSVTSINMTPLRSEGKGAQASRQMQLHRNGSSTTPPVVGTGKENIQPQLRKAKTFDSGIQAGNAVKRKL